MLNIINVLKYSCSNLCYFGKVSVLFSMVFPMISYSQNKQKIMIILFNQRNSYIALAAHANGIKIIYEMVVMKNETDIY